MLKVTLSCEVILWITGTREDMSRFAFINGAIVAGVEVEFSSPGEQCNDSHGFQARPSEGSYNGEEETHLRNFYDKIFKLPKKLWVGEWTGRGPRTNSRGSSSLSREITS